MLKVINEWEKEDDISKIGGVSEILIEQKNKE